MPVRTKQLWLGEMTSSSFTAYTVPSGRRTIVKEISLASNGASATTRCIIRVGGQNKGYVMWTPVVASQHLRFERWTVLEAGHALILFTDAGTPSTQFVVISGTELVL